MKILVGAVLLVVGIAVVLLLKPAGKEERLVVRFPGAWIVTFWIGAAVSLIVTGYYG
jgi:hypothetical protein